MFTYERPVYASSLDELSWVLGQLDQRYGIHDIKDSKKKNGEYALRFILKYLSYHRESTCEEIAKAEYEKNLQSQRKLKSITDDVRKFVKNTLIGFQLVYEGEPKKISNKQVKTYSLSPIGILYAIHLFGNVRETKERRYEISDFDINFIKSIVKEYSQTLPKIFNKFKLFEKIFGKDFISVFIFALIPVFSTGRSDFYDERDLLHNYVLTYFSWFKPLMTDENLHDYVWTVHGFIAEQISLIFYITLEDCIVDHLQNQDSIRNKIAEMSHEQINEYFKNRQEKDYREYPKMAKQIWLEIMNDDKELKKWYNNFLVEAVKSKKIEYEVVAKYHKEGLSKKYPF